MKKNLIFAVAAVTMLLASCTIQQRVYQPGLHIEWNGLHAMQKQSNVDQNESEQIATFESSVTVSNDVAVLNEPSASNEAVSSSVAPEPIVNTAVVEKEQKVSKKVLKQVVKELKQNVSALVSNESPVAAAQSSVATIQNGGEPESWVYVLLILLVPFGCTIAMYLNEGSWTKKVTTNLILTLLCGIPGLIHALVNIFGKK